MSETLFYKVQFYTEWHCGSGLSAGADVDAMVIRDKDGLPYVPGKTLKGLIREAVEDLNCMNEDTMHKLFGMEATNNTSEKDPHHGTLFFSNAVLPKNEHDLLTKHRAQDLLYRTKASTALDDSGVAVDSSLRRIETVVPCTLEASISDVEEEHKEALQQAMKYIKRLGLNRNRGLGRCHFHTYKREERQ